MIAFAKPLQFDVDERYVIDLMSIKGAVCKFLTLLKHKNTIICLYIFKKQVNILVYLKNNATVS